MLRPRDQLHQGKNEFEKSLNKEKYVYFLHSTAVSLYCTSAVWVCEIRIVHNNLNSIVLLCPKRLDDPSVGCILLGNVNCELILVKV